MLPALLGLALACSSAPDSSQLHGAPGAGARGGAGAAGFGGQRNTGGFGYGGSPIAGGAGGSAGFGTGGAATGGAPALVPIPPPAPAGCVTDVTPGVHEFPCDATTHVVSVPSACTSTACGVIIDVHGGSMSADMEDKNTNMRALGAQHGYIVIQPNALPNPFLAGTRVFVAGADDTRVMNILNNVIQAFHVDQKRIHIMGFSEGGYMSWRWICAHSAILASAAPAAAGWNCTVLKITEEIGCEFTGAAVPARNIPILYMQGHKDALVNPQCVFTWLSGNVYPTLELGAEAPVAGDTTYSRTRFLDPAGVPFELITHQYATDAQFFGVGVQGHCYPGSTDFTVTLPGQLMGFGCKDPSAFHWGEEAIEFFKAHPKP